MTGKHALLAITLLLLASVHLQAQGPQQIVNIQLHPDTPARTIQVAPPLTRVCRNTPGCPTEYKFHWTGPTGDETERIWVKYEDGLYWADGTATKVAATECFAFPGGDNPFELEHQVDSVLVFREGNEGCPDKVAFFYEISCKGGAGGNCGGVKPLDPGTMVDNGRRGGP